MSNTYLIEQGIPVPNNGSRKGALRMTLEKLQVGESFVVPSKGERSHAITSAGLVGIKVKTASIKYGYRIWRIK